MDQITRPIERPIASTTEQALHTFPPFSGELKVDENLKYERRQPNQLEKYIRVFLPDQQSKTATLNKVARYPNPYELATLASTAYQEESGTYQEENEKSLPKRWELLIIARNRDRTNGYVGKAYLNKRSKQIVISHRGTNPKNLGADWTDLKGIVFNKYAAQMNSASTFANDILRVVQNINQKYNTCYQLFFTGHSLGGWLAQITTFTVKYLVPEHTNTYFQIADPEGYHAHAVVFDSPGCRPMLSQMQDSFSVRYEAAHALSIDTLDITSYLSAPNRINSCNLHTGKIYRIFIDLADMKKALCKWSDYNLITHSMTNLLKAFDPTTGQVYKDKSGRLKIQLVTDWPLMRFGFGTSEYDEFFKWATELNDYHPDPKSTDFKATLAEKGYPIRYQTQPFDEQACSMHVFSASEQKFLKQYRLLQKFDDCFKPSSLFNKIGDTKAQCFLDKITIQGDTINGGSALDLYYFIPYIKNLLSLFPEIKTEVENKCSDEGIRNNVYQLYSQRYVQEINQTINLLDFKNDDHPIKVTLKDFLGNKVQQVWQLDTKEDTDVGLTRVYKTLKKARLSEIPLNYQDQNNHTILQLNQLLSTNQLISITSLLAAKKKPHLLMVECHPSQVNQFEVAAVFSSLFQAVKSRSLDPSNPLIKIILITQEDNNTKSLTKVFETLINQNVDNDKYIVTKDQGFRWSDLMIESQKQLLEKRIIFQGKPTNLAELFKVGPSQNDQTIEEAINKVIDPHTLVKLIHDPSSIRIGSKPLATSDLEGAYSELFEEINKETLISKLLLKQKNIYIISGIPQTDTKNKFIEALGLKRNYTDKSKPEHIKDKIANLTKPYLLQPGNQNIQLVDSKFQEENFKEICHNHSDKKVYSIKWDAPKFILQKLYNPDFYSSRAFNKIVIKKEVTTLLTEDKKDLFIFSSIDDHKKLADFFGLNEKNSPLDENRIFSIQDENKARDQFNELSNTVHWLEIEDNEGKKQLIWRNSKGKLDELRKYIDKQDPIYLGAESALLASIQDKQAVIIADDPGMGKSTTLTKLCQSPYGLDNQSKLVESHWVININLKNHLAAIQRIETDHIDIPDFLSAVDKNLKDNLAQGLLQLALDKVDSKKFQKPLLITFDGLDEVLDKSDRNKVIELLKALKNNTNARFWITTRMQHQESLENALSLFAITFKPLDDDVQNIFIKAFFSNRLSLILNKQNFKEIFGNSDKKQDQTKIQQYTDAFIKNMKLVFKDNTSSFMGTPLQLYLFLGSKGSIKAFKNWAEYNADSVPNFDYLGKNILEVYEKFIDGKYDTYFKKESIIQEVEKKEKQFISNQCFKSLSKQLMNSFESGFLKEHEATALSVGLIKSTGSNLAFIHQTFAEYFASQVCVRWLATKSPFTNRSKQAYLLTYLFMDENHQLIRSFIDARLANTLQDLPENKLKEYGEVMKQLLENTPNMLSSKEWRKKGYTLLHIAAEEGNPNMVSFLLDSLNSVSQEMLKPFLLTKEHNYERAALHIAATHGHATVVAQLLKPFKDDQKTLKEIIKDKDIDESIALHGAAASGHAAVVAQLLGPFKDDQKTLKELVSNKDIGGYTALHIAVANNQVTTINPLLAPFKDDQKTLKEIINAKDDNGFTPLHLIAFRGDSTVLGGLLAYLDQETLKEVINEKDKAANTPLHIAANEGHAELIDEFLAIFKNDPETLKALLNVKNKYQDMTPLDLATKNGHGDAVAALQIYEQQCLKDEASAQVQAIEKVMSNTTSEVNIDLLKQAMCSMEGKGIGQSTADTTMVDKNIHNLTIPLHDIDDGKRQCGNL